MFDLPPFALNAFWISQFLIFIGFLFDLASFQFKAKKHLLICFTITTALISIHFWLLDEILPALALALSSIRFLVSIFTTHQAVKWIFYGLFTLVFITQYQNPIDIISWVCMMIFNTAAFSNDDKTLRRLMMGGTTLWIIYNLLLAKSPAIILMEFFFLSSNLIGYYRHYILPQKRIS